MTKRNIFREIAVDSDGQLLICVDGKLSGPSELLAIARRNSNVRELVQLVQPHGALYEANLDDGDPVGEVAALMSVAPGRSRIMEAPAEVFERLGDYGTEIVGDEPEAEPVELLIVDEHPPT